MLSFKSIRFYLNFKIIFVLLFIISFVLFYIIFTKHFYLYLIEPIVADAEQRPCLVNDYNPINTFFFIFLLIIFFIIIHKIVVNKNIKLSCASFFPIILFGAISRVLEDVSMFPKPLCYLFISPIIYIFIGLLTLFILYLNEKLVFPTGSVLCICTIVIFLTLPIKNYFALFLIVTIFCTTLIVFYAHLYLMNLKIFIKNLHLIGAHILDATTTFVGIEFFSYSEKHFLPNFLINFFGTSAVLYPIKIAIILFAIYVLEYRKYDTYTKSLIKLLIFVVGFAPGVRNMLRLAVGV